MSYLMDKPYASVTTHPDIIKQNIKITPSGQVTIGKEHAGKKIKLLTIELDKNELGEPK